MRFIRDFGTQAFWLQTGTMAAILAVGLGLHFILALLTRQRRKRLASKNPILSALAELSLALISPGLTLSGGYIAFEVFKAFGWPRDLLLKITQLFWIILGFAFLSVLTRHIARPSISRKAFRFILLPLLALLLILHSLDMLMPLVAFARTHYLGFGEFQISVYGLVVGSALIFLFYRLAVWIERLLESRFLPKTLGDESVSPIPARLVTYAILGLGIFVILDTVGMNLTTLQILAGAIGVGVGFGLQRLFLDFFAGMALLGEKSLAPGHIVEIDGEIGTVKKLGFRSFVVETLNHVSLVIPNSALVEGKLINYTRDGDLVRITVPVPVSYSSEPREVEKALLAAGKRLEEKMDTMILPKVIFDGFGDSSLNFTLAVWVHIDSARQLVGLRTELRYLIWDSLKEHGITIPFPQVDVHIKEGPRGERFT
ncbi:MAG: mechanosensitive ion channel domain-containing protein [candidate division WOR-3 bacterium]